MEAMNDELAALVQRAKQARNAFPSLKAPDSLAAVSMADELARIGADFVSFSVRLKQAARAAADADAEARNSGHRPQRRNAAQMAAEMRRRGAYSVTP